jgi:hypothetical protein
LPTDIRLGKKRLTVINSLAYCNKDLITAVKCFITQANVVEIMVCLPYSNALAYSYSAKRKKNIFEGFIDASKFLKLKSYFGLK